MKKSIDWRDHGAVSTPMIQGNCGACWAFTASGALEGAHYIAYTEKLIPSVQQLIDCTSNQEKGGNYGCEGGFIDYAYEYSISTPVIENTSYPYTENVGKCKMNDKTFQNQLKQRELLREQQKNKDESLLPAIDGSSQKIKPAPPKVAPPSQPRIKGVQAKNHYKMRPQDPD